MRAPIFPASPPDSEWPALRAAVKGLIDACGWEPVAQRLGTGRDSLRDLLNRKRPPGRGRRARLVRLLEAPPARPAENGRFDA
jgi:hypothetical protein